MGARIVLCDPHRAVIAGPSPLHGQVVDSPDIRAGMAMLLAALAARGDSVIHNIGQIERGYERIDERLRALGAQIERIDDGGAVMGGNRRERAGTAPGWNDAPRFSGFPAAHSPPLPPLTPPP